MSFKEAAIKYLGRDKLIHMHSEGVEEMLKNDPSTLRAEMDVSPDEFNQILENYMLNKKRPEKRKVISMFDEVKNDAEKT